MSPVDTVLAQLILDSPVEEEEDLGLRRVAAGPGEAEQRRFAEAGGYEAPRKALPWESERSGWGELGEAAEGVLEKVDEANLSMESKALLEEVGDMEARRRQPAQHLQARHRVILMLVAQGYNNTQIRAILGHRGIRTSSWTISRLLQSPLFIAEVERLQAKCEAPIVEATIVNKEMVTDALRLLHDATKGAVRVPVIDADGQVNPSGLMHRVVDTKDRIKASVEILNRNVETAPVTKEYAGMGRGALSEADLEFARSHFAAVRNSIPVEASVVETAQPLFMAEAI